MGFVWTGRSYGGVWRALIHIALASLDALKTKGMAGFQLPVFTILNRRWQDSAMQYERDIVNRASSGDSRSYHAYRTILVHVL